MDYRVAGVLALLAIVGSTVARSVPTATYDQRQEGKVNVQIDVKDVQIVALIDSDMLEDYTVSYFMHSQCFVLHNRLDVFLFP